MTIEPMVHFFNNPSNMTLRDWWNCEAYRILRNMPCEYTDTEWIKEMDMTDDEKKAHPSYQTTGGYLKVTKHEADKQAWWDKLPDEDKHTVMALPNFDADIFYQCTGIRAQEGETE